MGKKFTRLSLRCPLLNTTESWTILDLTQNAILKWPENGCDHFLLKLDPFSANIKKQTELELALEQLKKWLETKDEKLHLVISLSKEDFLSASEDYFQLQLEMIYSYLMGFDLFVAIDLPKKSIYPFIPLIYTRPMSYFTPIFHENVALLHHEQTLTFSKKAILIDQTVDFTASYLDLIEEVEKKQQWICVIEACNFSSQWEGIEVAYYDPKIIDTNIERQLLGFEAAGGLAQPLAP